MNCAGICSQFEGDNETCEEPIADGVANKTNVISAFALMTGSILLVVGVALGALTFTLWTNFFDKKPDSTELSQIIINQDEGRVR